VKIFIPFFAALLCATGLYAQSQPSSALPASPENGQSLQDKTDVMLRRLREALTDPERTPSATAQAPSPQPQAQLPAPQTDLSPPQPELVAPAPQISPTPATPAPTIRPVPVRPGGPATPGFSPAAPGTIPARPGPPPSTLPGAPSPAIQQPPITGPGFAPPITAPPADPTSSLAAGVDPTQIIEAGMIQFQGMALDQFFEVYSLYSGRTIIRPYTIAGAPAGITLRSATDLTRQEAVFAMDSVLAQNDIAMIPVGAKFVKAVPMQRAPAEGGPLSNVLPLDYAEAEPFVTQVVELRALRPSEIQPLLATFAKTPNGITAFDNTQTLVLRDYASNVKRMLEVLKSVDVPRESDYRLEVIPIRYGKVEDIHNTMQALITGAAAPTAAPQTGQIGVPRTGMGGRAGTGRATGTMGSPFGTGYGSPTGGAFGRSYGGGGSYAPYEESLEIFSPMQAVTAQPVPTAPRTGVGAAQTDFQRRLSQIVRRASGPEEVQVLEDARIVPDYRSNKLLVFANRRDLEMITNLVSKVDVLLAQVLIEAVIMEVSLGDTHRMGINVVQNPRRFGSDFTGGGGINNPGQAVLGTLTNFAGSLPPGLTYYGQIAQDWSVVINALATDSTANVISRPRIQTSHAIPGSFFLGETVPYITGFTDYGGFGTGIATRSVVQQAQVGFNLTVVPFITPEGLVVMEISQNFDTRGADVLIDNNPVPIINNRTADATLTVRDGDTIMMGGFISENRSRSKSGVPVLKDIPGLGVLFRSKTQNNNRTELIVLMRARILRSPEDAAILAFQERMDLPGIRQAETEIDRAAETRRERAGKPRR
jgi:general secretion pathway protein D